MGHRPTAIGRGPTTVNCVSLVGEIKEMSCSTKTAPRPRDPRRTGGVTFGAVLTTRGKNRCYSPQVRQQTGRFWQTHNRTPKSTRRAAMLASAHARRLGGVEEGGGVSGSPLERPLRGEQKGLDRTFPATRARSTCVRGGVYRPEKAGRGIGFQCSYAVAPPETLGAPVIPEGLPVPKQRLAGLP